MLVTMALIILGSAILVFFSEELASAFKTLFAIPGVQLILPLLVVTQLVLAVEPGILLFLACMHDFLVRLSQGLVFFLPDNIMIHLVSQVDGLCLLVLLPVWILNAWSLRKTFKLFPYRSILGAMLWLVWSALLVLL